MYLQRPTRSKVQLARRWNRSANEEGLYNTLGYTHVLFSNKSRLQMLGISPGMSALMSALPSTDSLADRLYPL